MDLQDEFVRSKRMMDERQYEAGKLHDENVKGTEQNLDLRDRAAGLERDIEMLKGQRADNWREISRLKDTNDQRMKEQGDNGERIKALDYDLSRGQARIDDLQKLIDGRNYELRNKEMLFDDAQREQGRTADDNARLGADNGLLRSDIDRQTADNYELRKQLEYTESKNADMAGQARNMDARLRDREDQVYGVKKDLEGSRTENQRMRGNNIDNLQEKEALEKHAAVLNDQNNGLNRELDKFIETDEMVRSQLDRRGRVQGMRSTNDYTLQKSYAHIEEARSRSPQRRY
jgi:chromosome segregation ATPase